MEINQIYNEDCLHGLKRLEDNCINLVVTSPPYDSMRDYKGYSFEFEKIAKELYRVIKRGGIVVWVVGDETKNFCESLTSFKQAIYFVESVGFNLLDTMIYQKNGSPSPYPNLKRYALCFEYMFIFSKGSPETFNPLKDRQNKSYGKINSGNTARQRDGKTISTGSYLQQRFSIRPNIWVYDVGKNKDTKDSIAMSHPARFPEKLAEDHILSWSNEGDLVFDPMCGSGTTCKMALKNGRNFIGMDISKEYCEIANKRLQDVQLPLAVNKKEDGLPPTSKEVGIRPTIL